MCLLGSSFYGRPASVGGHGLGDREIVGEMGASMRVGGVGAVVNLCFSEVAAR